MSGTGRTKVVSACESASVCITSECEVVRNSSVGFLHQLTCSVKSAVSSAVKQALAATWLNCPSMCQSTKHSLDGISSPRKHGIVYTFFSTRGVVQAKSPSFARSGTVHRPQAGVFSTQTSSSPFAPWRRTGSDLLMNRPLPWRKADGVD